MERAYVQGVDRRTGVAQCLALGETVAKPCTYLGDAPPPRAIVWIDQVQSGQWVVAGGESPVERVLHEDFGLVFPYNLTPLIVLLGDLTWLVHDFGNNGSIVGVSTVTGTGFLRRMNSAQLVTGTLAGAYLTIEKGGPGPWLIGDGALWMHTVVAVSQPDNLVARIGFGDVVHAVGFQIAQAGFRMVGLEFESNAGPNWYLHTVVDLAGTFTDTGIAVVANHFYDIDLVVVPGLWAAAWIDGQIVAAHSTNIPAYGDPLSTMAGVFPRADLQRSIHVDLISVATIGGVYTQQDVPSAPVVVSAGGGGPSTYPFPDVVPTAMVPLVAGSPVDPITGLNVGDHVTFRVTWLNQGGVATPAGVIHDELIRVDGADVTWGDLTHAAIAPGGTANIDTGPTWTFDPAASGLNQYWTATAGDHLIQVLINGNGRIDEGGAVGNNVLTVPMHVSTAAGIAPIITTANPPDHVEDSPYTYTFVATGTAVITWSVNSGALPTGLTLSAGGILSGTPTTPGTYTFTVRATNGFGFQNSSSIVVVITAASVAARIPGMAWLSIFDVDQILSNRFPTLTLGEVDTKLGGNAMISTTDARDTGAFPSWVADMMVICKNASPSDCAFGCYIASKGGAPPQTTAEKNASITGLGHVCDVAVAAGVPYVAVDCEPYGGDGTWWTANGADASVAYAWGTGFAALLVANGLKLLIYPSSQASFPGSYNDIIGLQQGNVPPGGIVSGSEYTNNVFKDFLQGLVDGGADVTHTDASFHWGVQYYPDGGSWVSGTQRTVGLVASHFPGVKGSVMEWADNSEGHGFFDPGSIQVATDAASRYSTGPWTFYQHWRDQFPPNDESLIHDWLDAAYTGWHLP